MNARVSFLPSLQETLVERSVFSDRAYVEPHLIDWLLDPATRKSNLLGMTAKILFDAKANLKTINLAFAFSRVGVYLTSLQETPEWILWLQGRGEQRSSNARAEQSLISVSVARFADFIHLVEVYKCAKIWLH